MAKKREISVIEHLLGDEDPETTTASKSYWLLGIGIFVTAIFQIFATALRLGGGRR